MGLGNVSVGENQFTALIKNKTDVPLSIGLDLRTTTGLWIRRSWQNQYAFQLGPQEETFIEANYNFFHISPETWLRVRFGIPSIQNGGVIEIKNILFEKKYFVGKGNKSADRDTSQFVINESDHFKIYCYRGSLAEKDIKKIINQRESGFRVISELLGVTYPGKIRLVFYPDAETKKDETGSMGDGYAFSNNIVEIYNEQTKLDPFHEVAHIIAGQLGEPPALFNEGFAVYASEKSGADALKYLGSPGKTIDEAVESHRHDGQFIPFDSLITYTDIGPTESKPVISYPEGASIVKYLYEVYGREKFLKVYKTLQNSDEPDVVMKNKEILKQVYGKSISELEKEWLKKFK